MGRRIVYGAGILLVVAGSAVVAALEQTYPGQATQGKVWVQNEGRQQAVPVSLADVGLDAPMKVQVTSLPPVAVDGIVQARRARQVWEYRTIVVRDGQDPLPTINSAGADGWETTGLQFGGQGSTTLLMKRPR